MPLPRAVALLAFTLACGPDPREAEAREYVELMTPAVAENAALARRSLELAGQLQKKAVTADAAARVIETEVLPEVREVETAARGVLAGSDGLQRAHHRLLDAWSARADAIADLARTWHAGDVSGFDAATKAERAASEAEAAGFREINLELSRYGLSLDPYPSASAAASSAPSGG